MVSSFHSSFEQLKMAITHLKRQANKKSEGSLAYVKGGLSTFFEAQDALSGRWPSVSAGASPLAPVLSSQRADTLWHWGCLHGCHCGEKSPLGYWTLFTGCDTGAVCTAVTAKRSLPLVTERYSCAHSSVPSLQTWKQAEGFGSPAMQCG